MTNYHVNISPLDWGSVQYFVTSYCEDWASRLEVRYLSAIRNSLSAESQLPSTPVGRLLHPQPEGAPCYCDGSTQSGHNKTDIVCHFWYIQKDSSKVHSLSQVLWCRNPYQPTNQPTPWNRILPRMPTVAHIVRNSPPFMENEGSLPFL
jgi:hypothetical protein